MKIDKSNLFVSTSVAPFEEETLEQRLAELQRNARCVWRAVRLMVFLTALAVAGIGHSIVLIPDWPQTMRQFTMLLPIKAHCALGLASLTCTFLFSMLGLVYRRELNALLASKPLAEEMPGLTDARVIPITVGTPDSSGLPEAA